MGAPLCPLATNILRYSPPLPWDRFPPVGRQTLSPTSCDERTVQKETHFVRDYVAFCAHNVLLNGVSEVPVTSNARIRVRRGLDRRARAQSVPFAALLKQKGCL